MIFNLFLDNVERIDNYLDTMVGDEYKHQPLAQDWARISKISEELGEVVDAWILHTGQNPRKPQINNMGEVLEELADTAMTAILAMQHFTKDKAKTGDLLVSKARKIMQRAAGHRESVNGTVRCDGCGRNFLTADAEHSPCNPSR